MLDGLHLLLVCRELLGKVLNSIVKETTLRDGSIKKANFVSVPYLHKVKPEMAFLDDHGGHCLTESPHRDFSRS